MDRIRYVGPSRLTDNELHLLQEIVTIVEYTDPGFIISICKNPENIIAHITPSSQDFRQGIIDNLLYVNKVLKVRIHFSSSLGISRIISFTVNLDITVSDVSLPLHN